MNNISWTEVTIRQIQRLQKSGDAAFEHQLARRDGYAGSAILESRGAMSDLKAQGLATLGIAGAGVAVAVALAAGGEILTAMAAGAVLSGISGLMSWCMLRDARAEKSFMEKLEVAARDAHGQLVQQLPGSRETVDHRFPELGAFQELSETRDAQGALLSRDVRYNSKCDGEILLHQDVPNHQVEVRGGRLGTVVLDGELTLPKRKDDVVRLGDQALRADGTVRYAGREPVLASYPLDDGTSMVFGASTLTYVRPLLPRSTEEIERRQWDGSNRLVVRSTIPGKSFLFDFRSPALQPGESCVRSLHEAAAGYRYDYPGSPVEILGAEVTVGGHPILATFADDCLHSEWNGWKLQQNLLPQGDLAAYRLQATRDGIRYDVCMDTVGQLQAKCGDRFLAVDQTSEGHVRILDNGSWIEFQPPIPLPKGKAHESHLFG